MNVQRTLCTEPRAPMATPADDALPKIVLVLMVKNESAIINRCLEAALQVCDAMLIADTGSSDDTVARARAYNAVLPTKVVEHVWKDFGHNRTLAFLAAQAFVRDELAWSTHDMMNNFAMLLDADMVFCVGKEGMNAVRRFFAEETRKAQDSFPPRPAPSGFGLSQIQGALDYVNTRFLRFGVPWFCRGDTHEFWQASMPAGVGKLIAAPQLTQCKTSQGRALATKARLQDKLAQRKAAPQKGTSVGAAASAGAAAGAGVGVGGVHAAAASAGAESASAAAPDADDLATRTALHGSPMTGPAGTAAAVAAWERIRQYMGTIVNVPKALAWINDVSDGGCKADKYPRDLAFLLAAIERDPSNKRYMFYLAQTYKDMHKPQEAIKWYKKRIAAKGWEEELWYSHYMLARQYITLAGDVAPRMLDATAPGATPEDVVKARLQERYIAQAEEWVDKAAAVRPSRAEALAMFVTVLRQCGRPHDALRYLKRAKAVPMTTDILFVEPGAYGERLVSEEALLHFAATGDADAALDRCIVYDGYAKDLVRNTVPEYLRQLGGGGGGMAWTQLTVPEIPQPFVSSSVSARPDGVLNIRAVNYRIQPDGSYAWPQDAGVCTRNYMATWDPEARAITGPVTEVTLPEGTGLVRNPGATIHGLEDIRLFGATFTATSPEFGPQGNVNRMIIGTDYPTMATARLAQPPKHTWCEKNWIPIDGDGMRFVYSWSPLVIGELPRDGNTLRVVYESTDVPAWFVHARGSTPPMLYKSNWWFLVHLVFGAAPRTYAHAWVVMNPETYDVVASTRPFFLRHRGIEYVLGAQVWQEHVHVFASVWDRESWVGVLPMAECEALLLPSPSALRRLSLPEGTRVAPPRPEPAAPATCAGA